MENKVLKKHKLLYTQGANLKNNDNLEIVMSDRII